METKKNPSKDLSLQRNKFFLIGLVSSIALMITAFEWKTAKVNPKPREYEKSNSEVAILIPITNIDLPKVPQPISKEPSVKNNSITPSIIVAVHNQIPVIDLPPINLDPESNSTPTAVSFVEPPEKTDSIFFIVEKKPEPITGFGNFYKLISKNLKYPRQARQLGTEGKVLVEFIINKSGDPSDLKIIRGIGAGCDEEAMRVLALIKWEPGKQRGKPVRVKMILPIYFKLGD